MIKTKGLTRLLVSLLICVASLQEVTPATLNPTFQVIDKCEALIIGGTTAALGAALASSSHVKTCLTEPTDWVGGQLTAEGLSEIDFAFHKIVDPKTNFTLDVGAIAKTPANINPLFTQILKEASNGDPNMNPGKCWGTCMLQTDMLKAINRRIALKGDNLTIFYNTVPKSVSMDSTGRKIIGVEMIQRQSAKKTNQFSFLSEELEDWYTREDSAQYTKHSLHFTGFDFITDATPFGDVMVLSNASFLQGVAERFDGDISGQGGSDTCGQSFAYNFAEKLVDKPTADIPVPNPRNSPKIDDSVFSFAKYPWEMIVTYRRVHGNPTDTMNKVSVGDVTVQNWGGGNDQRWSYIFLSKEDARAQAKNWKGGLNISSLIMGEALSLEYHKWFRKNAPAAWANKTVLSPETMNTTTGLAKMPYLRDTRRSIGIDDFVITMGNISGTAEQMVGTIYPDRVAIGAYNVDIHGLKNCSYPSHIMGHHYDILPYYIPFRAMTNRDVDNLIVAGKTMAMSFASNAAIRLHPEEFASGQAAGTAMAFGVLNKIETTRGIYGQVGKLQQLVKQVTPIAWTINGSLYPHN